MKREIVDALMHDAESKINLARMDVFILLNNPVGVGDHPNITGTIQKQLDIMSQNKDRLNILREYFDE
tara:strand:- start:154 stop:357 length:204 start_codon:yes stop_codon:yes gene_type:complete